MPSTFLLGFLSLAISIAVAHADVAAFPPPITQKISSFGACVSEDYIYVYGGHTGDAHDHSRENLSADFIRIDTNDAEAQWETLPGDQAVQGTALVAWNGMVIRVGGMFATNAPDEDSVMFSTDSIRCYDPKATTWSDWPSLPGKISSHDAVVMNDILYVVGGWKLDGGDGTWHEHGWSLDLNNRDAGWKELPPMPGVRRAGTAAATDGELWYVGGISDGDGTSNASFAYDLEKKTWREGPVVPDTSRTKSFGNSTFSVGGKLFTSGMNGILYSLDPASDEWTATTVAHMNGRIFHRSIPIGDGTFWTIAGASKKGHLSDIEVLPIPAQFPAVSSVDAWPAFRGGANNEVADRKMPRSWSDDSNIDWKVTLPGEGQSTPVYGNGGIYVTSSILAETPKKKEEPAAQPGNSKENSGESKGGKPGKGKGGKGGKGGSMADFMKANDGPLKTDVAITRIDQKTGQIDWTATVPSSDPLPNNNYRSNAAPSPCFDDEAVYAWFETGDLVAVDHDGEKLWHHNIGEKYGLPKGNHGLGGSLVQDRESLYLLVDHDGPSYLVCLDKEKGEARWKIDREKRVAWSTPVVTKDAVIICSNGIVEEIDKANGEQRWIVDGLEGNTVASPLVFQDFVLAPSSDGGQTQLIRRGETDERIVWKASGKSSSSFSSPVFAQGQIVLVSKAGVAFGLNWRTGEELWNLRLPEGCWATPAVVGSNIYFFSTPGMTMVTSLTPSGLSEQHTNELSVGTSKVYGVIPAGDQWIVRTAGEVTAIGKPADEEEES